MMNMVIGQMRLIFYDPSTRYVHAMIHHEEAEDEYDEEELDDMIADAWKENREREQLKIMREQQQQQRLPPHAEQKEQRHELDIQPEANDILRHLSSRLPKSKFGEPEETPLKGIFRLSMDDSIIYISSDGRYVFLGDMVDLVAGRNFSKKGLP